MGVMQAARPPEGALVLGPGPETLAYSVASAATVAAIKHFLGEPDYVGRCSPSRWYHLYEQGRVHAAKTTDEYRVCREDSGSLEGVRRAYRARLATLSR